MLRHYTLPVIYLQKHFIRSYVKHVTSNFRISKKELPNEYEESESDFMNVHNTHKMYEQESFAYKEKIHHLMIKNKYFKKTHPNFLTWSEKEQIRFLHDKDSKEWNVERLSVSFPADTLTITKIIKSKWYPTNEKRIRKHDLKVKENWKLFKENNLPELENVLKKHLEKFVHRDFTEIETKHLNKKDYLKLHEPRENEFTSIITSCKKYSIKELDLKHIVQEEKVNVSRKVENQLLLNSSKSSTKSITLKGLKNQEFERNQRNENFLLQIPDNPGGTGNITVSLNQTVDLLQIKKFDSYIGVINENEENQKEKKIREHIRIPKKLMKDGATYKLDDCFYDDDGEFLYRVPGM